ncbi:fibronectin type III domain-containing protein [Mycobacterium sp. CBMA293]|uniref:fibronectin type III domain-containing protein n=1 Tax=unclassified Mycolicibacterium TaxID=2636767 RepID=UPI0012DD4FB6|nr:MULTISPECIES: fibronectin type III domain-containing protein [unclassified Mycolicibacterium]MUL62071.1 fibronectin type III domain-containing protein [Mycolicibacterium sp. CBMA 335]MUM14613.1 fibronectin type III domain-containing protein [Mycolicibacterium sp. CBMA 293]MUM31055.1 fibronectin type III domain-containing protein [Mycolicibacterium sp. CBMA 361]
MDTTSSPRRFRVLTRATCLATVVSAVTPLALAAATFTPTSGRPFASTSVWNSAIVSNPAMMANSAAMAARLNSGQHIADLNDYAIPIYNAVPTSPVVSVQCTEPWGTCPLPSSIRLPAGAIPNAGSDHALVNIDWSTNPPISYEFWDANIATGNSITTAWGGITVNLLNGSGIQDGGGTVGATATNVSRLAGVIRLREIQDGVIPHALAIASSVACTDYFRYPAAKTDGRDISANCVPEGTRVQLNPAINISSLPIGEKIIAKALQTYGAYVIDQSAVPVAMAFEGDSSLIGKSGQLPAVYRNAGFAWDYYDMVHIPWSGLRVLQQWNGRADTTAPTAPASVTATSVAARNVTVAWYPSSDGQGSGVAGYYLWRSDTSGRSWTLVASGTPANLVDTTAQPSQTYLYGVRAQDGVGNISAASNIIQVQTPSS